MHKNIYSSLFILESQEENLASLECDPISDLKPLLFLLRFLAPFMKIQICRIVLLCKRLVWASG